MLVGKANMYFRKKCDSEEEITLFTNEQFLMVFFLTFRHECRSRNCFIFMVTLFLECYIFPPYGVRYRMN
jgi:hypothetical protein